MRKTLLLLLLSSLFITFSFGCGNNGVFLKGENDYNQLLLVHDSNEFTFEGEEITKDALDLFPDEYLTRQEAQTSVGFTLNKCDSIDIVTGENDILPTFKPKYSLNFSYMNSLSEGISIQANDNCASLDTILYNHANIEKGNLGTLLLKLTHQYIFESLTGDNDFFYYSSNSPYDISYFIEPIKDLITIDNIVSYSNAPKTMDSIYITLENYPNELFFSGSYLYFKTAFGLSYLNIEIPNLDELYAYDLTFNVAESEMEMISYTENNCYIEIPNSNDFSQFTYSLVYNSFSTNSDSYIYSTYIGGGNTIYFDFERTMFMISGHQKNYYYTYSDSLYDPYGVIVNMARNKAFTSICSAVKIEMNYEELNDDEVEHIKELFFLPFTIYQEQNISVRNCIPVSVGYEGNYFEFFLMDNKLYMGSSTTIKEKNQVSYIILSDELVSYIESITIS